MSKYINMILIKLSFNHKVFYMEKRNYKNGKSYKTYIIRIDELTKEFTKQYDLLNWLSQLIKEMV